jgi:hypothetical protein
VVRWRHLDSLDFLVRTPHTSSSCLRGQTPGRPGGANWPVAEVPTLLMLRLSVRETMRSTLMTPLAADWLDAGALVPD